MLHPPSVYADLTVTENFGTSPRWSAWNGAVIRQALTTSTYSGTPTVDRDPLGGERSRVRSRSPCWAARPAGARRADGRPRPVLRRDLWALFHRLSGSGVSLLVSSHVMDEAARCDRLVLLRGEGPGRRHARRPARPHRSRPTRRRLPGPRRPGRRARRRQEQAVHECHADATAVREYVARDDGDPHGADRARPRAAAARQAHDRARRPAAVRADRPASRWMFNGTPVSTSSVRCWSGSSR